MTPVGRALNSLAVKACGSASESFRVAIDARRALGHTDCSSECKEMPGLQFTSSRPGDCEREATTCD